MNNLFNYGIDSDSESDEPIAIITPTTSYNKEDKPEDERRDHDGDILMRDPERGGGGSDDGFAVSIALQDLQSFAASMEAAMESSPTTTTPTPTPTPTPTTTTSSSAVSLSVELTPEQQLAFNTFLQDIDDIPLTAKDQSRPPHQSSPSLAQEPDLNHDPVSSSGVSSSLLSSADSSLDELEWQKSQTVQSIYSRMHQLSLLTSPTVDLKDIENRLIEFAIRILDWEQGGMKPAYFMGEARALAETQRETAKKTLESSDADELDEEEKEKVEEEEEEDEDIHQDQDLLLPPYAGIVGEMLEHMHTVEQSAAPAGWKIVWSPKDGAYRFRHVAT
ncbi:hypothetical protein BGZ65_004932, partial [Modicella reniformis]